MLYLLSQRCIRTSLRSKFEQTAKQSGIFVPLAFVSSLQRKIFLDPERKTCFAEETAFSGNVAQSRPITRQQRTTWFGRSAKTSVGSAESFHRNVARNSRNLHTSNHVHSEKKFDNFGEMRENKIFTVPNILCFGRMLASPILGYFVLSENYLAALILFITAGFTDILDGFIARRFPSQMSYLGSVLDPIADKVLVGVLTISLSIAHLIPVPLAIIILGRDVGLIFGSFVVRFISLPQPKTFSRFFDFQLPTVQVTPSLIGKVNTVLQVALISLSLAAPILEITGHPGMVALQYTVGITTIVSGLDYVITRRGFSILGEK